MRKRNIRNYCKLNIIDNRHEAISCGQTLVSHTLCIIMWTPPMAKITQDIKPFCSYKLTQRYNRNTSTKLLKITERTDQLWDPSWELAYINIIFFLPLCAAYLFLSFQSFGINWQYTAGNREPQRDSLQPQHRDSGRRAQHLGHAARDRRTAAQRQLLNMHRHCGCTLERSSYIFTLTVPRLAWGGFLPKAKNLQWYEGRDHLSWNVQKIIFKLIASNLQAVFVPWPIPSKAVSTEHHWHHVERQTHFVLPPGTGRFDAGAEKKQNLI